MPLAYLDNQDLRNALETELTKAEKVGQALQSATRELAKLLLSSDVDLGGRVPLGEDERKLADRLSEARPYWSRLGTPFQQLLQGLPADPSAVTAWRRALRHAARTAFGTMIAGLDGTARNLKAVAGSERVFYRRLSDALDTGESTQQGGNAA